MRTSSHAKRYRAHARHGLIALALGSLSLTAQAVEWNKSTNFLWKTNGNISQGVPGAGSGSIISEVSAKSGGGVYLNGSRALPWHPQPDQYADWAKWKASITPQQIAKGVVRPGFVIPLIAGELISKLLNEACVRLAGGSMQLKDGAAWEECAPAGSSTTYKPATEIWLNAGRSDYSTSASQACSYMANPEGYQSAGVEFFGTQYPRSAKCLIKQTESTYTTHKAVIGSEGGCSVGGAWLPGGTMINGQLMCPVTETNEAFQPATPASVEAKIKDKVMNWTQADFSYGYTDKQGDGTGVVRELLDKGGTIESGPPEVSGPASSVGAPHTTTTINNVGGTTTTTTTNTNHYTYAGNQVSYTTTAVTVSQTCTAAGSCTTETETKTDDKPKDPEKEKEDECEKFPERVGCAELDTPDGDIPKREHNLTFTADSRFASSASCPANVYSPIHGQSVMIWDWTATCGFLAGYVRPVVLAMAAIAALFIVLPARSEA